MTTMPPARTFSLGEAQDLLPAVRERTRRAMEEIHTLNLSADEDEAADEGGAGASETFREEATRILADWARDVEALGVVVKGPWLVDFDCGGGYYCWSWPEESLDYFHGYKEGFAGRVRLQ
jgi:hypothetical protein